MPGEADAAGGSATDEGGSGEGGEDGDGGKGPEGGEDGEGGEAQGSPSGSPSGRGAWGASRSFAAVVRGSSQSPDGETRGSGGARRESHDSAGRREKLLSPDRKTAEAIAEEARARQVRAEAQREKQAAEEAAKLQKKRDREAQVAARHAELQEERKRALQAKMHRAEVSREANIADVASRARLENQKVEEVAFIKVHGSQTPPDERTALIDQRMQDAATRREAQHERAVAAHTEKAKNASERQRQRAASLEERAKDAGSKVDEAYQRWTEFTSDVAARAAESSRIRAEALALRRSEQEAALTGKREEIERRISDANERRLAHIHALLQTARTSSERQAQAQHTREARRATWADESEAGDSSFGGASAPTRERKSSGGSRDRKHNRRTRSVSDPGRSGGSEPCSACGSVSGDERSESAQSARSGGGRATGGGQQLHFSPAASARPTRSWADEEEAEAEAAAGEEAAGEGGGPLAEGEGGEGAASASDSASFKRQSSGGQIGVPPTLAALQGGAGLSVQAADASAQQPGSVGKVAPLEPSPLRAQAEAAQLAGQEARRERSRRLRARAKKVRQRMAATASGLRVEQLEAVWVGSASSQGNKRMLRVLAELSQLANQPASDGAELAAWELCRLLETGRQKDLHTVRTHGGIESLLTLACAGTSEPPDLAPAAPKPGAAAAATRAPVRPSTQTAAVRALLAACSLPQNRAYLLLTNLIDKLAFFLLPHAVETETRLEAASAEKHGPTAPADALLLPLLKILRLVVATPPPAEAGRKLRSDLVLIILYSGGLHSLREYSGACASTLASAGRHQPLLVQYFALLHVLLLPVHAEPAATCASPLKGWLEESGLCGACEMLCHVLFEAAQVAAPASASSPAAGWSVGATSSAAAAGGAAGCSATAIDALSIGVLQVCRTAATLLVHIASTEGFGPFLRRVLGAGELKTQVFHLSHLVLSLCEGHGTCADKDKLPEAEGLLHETLLLLGAFALATPKNAETLRWRWGAHPTMLHRLCELPFAYFVDPELRDVLLPTLISACHNDPFNFRILSSRLAPEHLTRYLRAQPEGAARELAPGRECAPAAVLSSDPSELPIVTMDYALAARFPPVLWLEATRYLSVRPESPAPEGIDLLPDPPARPP